MRVLECQGGRKNVGRCKKYGILGLVFIVEWMKYVSKLVNGMYGDGV